jgi:hypothetical protein
MTDLTPLLGPGAREISCDACFDRLDRFVEEELRGGPPPGARRARVSSPGIAGSAGGASSIDARFPGFRAHLAACPACAEEHESLRTLLELDDFGGRP